MAATKSFARKISDAEVMVLELKNHTEQVARRGIDAQFIDSLSQNILAATQLNKEQERLKAELKSKTAQLEAQLALIDKAYAEAKKIVKLDFKQMQWKEFGIEDKR